MKSCSRPGNKHSRHPQARPSRRLEAGAALVAILRDGRAHARELLRMTVVSVARPAWARVGMATIEAAAQERPAPETSVGLALARLVLTPLCAALIILITFRDFLAAA